ncbi:methylated-DNA--[protein]-cysteine S-methyltransferase [Francisella tularensis subsp. novicida]|uniref:methylated-DNA--[protein]-cysteine S-methyltransferase n=2 Tax=Francisella tularensis TaxID=263 RepID=A0A6I4RYK1_FRATU|nr:methylated-DNA--[protein]-cysteine S-methyltransferase [Francisella tularensis]ABK90393.1 methylated DNA-protein cysteine methyltransferase [Francisella tularensis subsp. novicida U112]AJI61775.1 methylated-DNA--[]-cysteine S-methyltransferase family protein [Francisella tularensis subsp. novicida U112]AVC43712.1 cysteine methyltransferase [Francisella tularensis subsp. novicida]EDX20167.1 methylated-DNA-(protein)-cysteine S-methyltransferase [Francisella tularensis subsp. novicida FTE]MBK2
MLKETHQIYLAAINKKSYKTVFYAQEIQTPIGNFIAVADDDYLYACFFINHSNINSIEKLLKVYNAKISFKTNDITNQTKNQLDKYFNKELKAFSIPLRLTGTDFQKQVWGELIKIPYGETISYLEEAKNIGNPTAFRAVANANGKNLFPIIIPCHRVINTNGKPGGYTCGLDKKEFLLNLESNKES